MSAPLTKAPSKPRGFAAIDRERARAIHVAGGLAVSRDRARMAANGRKGGLATQARRAVSAAARAKAASGNGQ